MRGTKDIAFDQTIHSADGPNYFKAFRQRQTPERNRYPTQHFDLYRL